MRAVIRAEWERFRRGLAVRPAATFVVAGLALCLYHYHHADWLHDALARHTRLTGEGLQFWSHCVGWNLTAFATLVILPWPVMALVGRLSGEPAPESGWRLGEWRLGATACAIFYAVAFVCAFIASRGQDFQNSYPLCMEARHSLSRLVIYEISFALYFTAWESFFRGFLTLGLEPAIGTWAIFVQMLPFVVIHFDKPPLEAASSVFGGIALGWLALRTRSFWYGAFLHASMAITLDVLVTVHRGFH